MFFTQSPPRDNRPPMGEPAERRLERSGATETKISRGARELVREQDAHELVFAVVGHIGSGAGTVARELKAKLADLGFDVAPLKASEAIRHWATENGETLPSPTGGNKYLSQVATMQDLGDKMRRTDHAAVAIGLVRMIRERRAEKTQQQAKDGQPVLPDGKPRAYVLDSLRHDAEVHLLRRLYGNSFVLVGVVCDESARVLRLGKKYKDGGEGNAKDAMARDEDDSSKKNGQKVREAFWLSDCFVDNSTVGTEEASGKVVRPHGRVTEQLKRLIQIVSYSDVKRPTLAETAMYVAYGAARRSACLSRSVGAALVDQRGNIVAIGVNDVPRAGGGLYGADLSAESGDHRLDHRCAYYPDDQAEESEYKAGGHCRNTREQKRIVGGIIEAVASLAEDAQVKKYYEDPKKVAEQKIVDLGKELQAKLKSLAPEETELLAQVLKKKGGIGELTEYSRAVHAEMEALLAAARSGISPVGSRLFVTTFPCHYCARHIVSAGVDEVQYIEPYPKSRALLLHRDSITREEKDWVEPSRFLERRHSVDRTESASSPKGIAEKPAEPKVLFRPFVGVSPNLYERVFTRDREWKDKKTGLLTIQKEPEWGSSLYLGKLSTFELEARLTSTKSEDPTSAKDRQ